MMTMMIGNATRLACAIGLATTVALGVAIAGGPAMAAEPAVSAGVQVAFEEPATTEGGVSVTVVLTTADGEPIPRQPVDFFVTPDFFGDRSLPLQTAITNAAGEATITYAPTWNGAHRLTASFAGDGLYQAGEGNAVLTVSGLPTSHESEPAALGAIRQWAGPGAVAGTIIVWLLLAGVLFRVGWGIWKVGHQGEERRRVPSPETARGPAR